MVTAITHKPTVVMTNIKFDYIHDILCISTWPESHFGWADNYGGTLEPRIGGLGGLRAREVGGPG